MLGLNRTSRPVDFGPYPLEKLKRDPSVAELETFTSGCITQRSFESAVKEYFQ